MRVAVVVLLAVASVGVGCTNITERQTSAVGTPTASQDADIIVDRYREDPKLGDDLFNDKTVEITAFRVDEVGKGSLTMKDRGYTLRLEDVSKPDIQPGDVLVLLCEGDGMEGDKVIVFERCAVR